MSRSKQDTGLDIVSGELERLFELDEMVSLSRDLLGLDPDEVGGAGAKGSFAKALATHCQKIDAMEALCDAIVATKANVSPNLAKVQINGLAVADELPVGASVDGTTLTRKLGEGRIGVSYAAKADGKSYRLKLLRSEATRDSRGLQRYLTITRLIGTIDHPNLPGDVQTGTHDGRHYLRHSFVEAQPLSVRIARTGPMHFNEARELIQQVLDALAALNSRRLAHGNLTLENVLVARGSEGAKVTLLDAGVDRLRARPRVNETGRELFATVSSPKTTSPEQIRGLVADARSDVYSFGAVIYELLTGKPVFDATSPVEFAIGHLRDEPAAPSERAPKGWISSELDEFILSLLKKNPDDRPQSAAALLEIFEKLGAKKIAEAPIDEAELASRIDAVIAEPDNEEAALSLESAADEGADPAQIADAFTTAVDMVEGESEAAKGTKQALLYRAARLLEKANPEGAEAVYVRLLKLDISDAVAENGLEKVRLGLGKYEELVEALLEKAERAESDTERAQAMAQIGRLYAGELDDKDQALVALTQAFCGDPASQAGDEYAQEIAKLAGSDVAHWNEVLSACAEASQEASTPESKHALLRKMGVWYDENATRPDHAAQCFQAVLSTDPSDETSLSGLANVYRKAQQWSELGMVLTAWADASGSPGKARDLRTEAAELLELQLNDAAGARPLYETILEADPTHVKAGDALARICQRLGDPAGLVKVLETRAAAQRGDELLRTLCRIAEVSEDELNDNAEATRRYKAVLASEPTYIEAIRGLDRLYSKAGQFDELLTNISRQIELAVTPRQKITLWERIAGIQDEEYLDAQKAADAWEEILDLNVEHEGALSALPRHYKKLERWESLAGIMERHLDLIEEPTRRIAMALDLAALFSGPIGSPDRALDAYQKVLTIEPQHHDALEAVAQLQEKRGDVTAALAAIDSLIEKATTPAAKAEQHIRAARLLDQEGDKDAAITRYQTALNLEPGNAAAATALRDAFAARGDAAAAMQLLEQELGRATTDAQRASLAGEIAFLAHTRIKDDSKAEEAARAALKWDDREPRAHWVLAEAAFASGGFLEASRHYTPLATRLDTFDEPQRVSVLLHAVQANIKLSHFQEAFEFGEKLLAIAPDSRDGIEAAARAAFEAKHFERAETLYAQWLDRDDTHLDASERAMVLYRLGESAREAEHFDAAQKALEESSELDPDFAAPLVALSALCESKEDWEQALKVKSRQLDLVEGAARASLLIEIGDLASTKLSDRTRAAKSYVAALEESPEDRRLLAKLMQLYSEEKDWSKLVDVVLKLADFVDEPAQKSKYLLTAAGLYAKQLGDVDNALLAYERVVELDAGNARALDEIIALRHQKGDHGSLEDLLRKKLDAATAKADTAGIVACHTQLGELQERQYNNIDKAIEEYEAAHALDPDNAARAELLERLYASDLEKYLSKAIAAPSARLRDNPLDPEPYKTLRQLYTGVKRADSVWCLCQALTVQKIAEPDEERFFKRMRPDGAAHAQDAVTSEDWTELLIQDGASPLLTSLFTIIEPAVLASRGQDAGALGFAAEHAIDLTADETPMGQTLVYAAAVLGIELPPAFFNANDPGGLSFLPTTPPSVVFGKMAKSYQIPPQMAAFIAARQLVSYRPGLAVRQLAPSGTGLKSWLFAAIQLISPQFPIAASLEGPVNEARKAIEAKLNAGQRDQLARVVSKLLESGGSLDLKRWVAGVDLTADRTGLLLTNDLETALEVIKASDPAASSVSAHDRQKELVLYSVSEAFFELRRRLGIGIDQ